MFELHFTYNSFQSIRYIPFTLIQLIGQYSARLPTIYDDTLHTQVIDESIVRALLSQSQSVNEGIDKKRI
jgi:hypothetical protein